MLACEHFHIYIYGRPFELETDHNPLELIYKAKVSNSDKHQPELRSGNYAFKSTTSRWYTVWEETTWPTPYPDFLPQHQGVTWKPVPTIMSSTLHKNLPTSYGPDRIHCSTWFAGDIRVQGKLNQAIAVRLLM